MIEFLESNPWMLPAFVAAGFILNGLVLHVGGRKAEARFHADPGGRIRFRERGASGYSRRSVLTSLGGATGALDVIVTDSELWLKGIWPLFSYIGARFDMVHKVPLSHIRRIDAQGRTVDVRFLGEAGQECHVVLRLKDPRAFIAAATPRG